MRLFTLFILGYIILSFSSCALVGLNIHHKTPKNAAKLPEFTEKDSLFGSLTRERNCFDVSYYDLKVEPDIDQQSLSGRVGISFSVIKPSKKIQVDLHRNMHLDYIIWNGDTLNYSRKFRAVYINFPEILVEGSHHHITLEYHGIPVEAKRPPWEGGFVWKNDKDKNPWVGVACEVAGSSLWWPMKDHLSDEPDSMQITLTVPEGLYGISNGKLIKQVTKNDKNIFTWKINYPINTYNPTLYIGNFEKFSIQYEGVDTVFDLDFYVLPENRAKAEVHFKQVIPIIRTFEELYGAYPWPRDGFKLIESPYAGMEHQTAIAYGSKYKNFGNYNFDHIILHETAHEWWGNSVSVKDFSEIWLHEGFATYSEALYLEKSKGYDSYINYMNFYSILIRNKKPLIGPRSVNYWNYKDADVYMKGALLLHTLRHTINKDSVFFDILKTFYQKNEYGFVDSKEFIDLVNSKTNDDYGWFFDQYLYSRVCPQLNASFIHNKEKNRHELHFRWASGNDNLKLPVKIKTKDKDFVIYPDHQIKTISLGDIEKIKINSDGKYIAIKRKRNPKNL
jgi:aminopeptidase N